MMQMAQKDVLKAKCHSHHQMERCTGLPSRSQAPGNAVGLLSRLGTCYRIYLKGHVTKRSCPTVPLVSGPMVCICRHYKVEYSDPRDICHISWAFFWVPR